MGVRASSLSKAFAGALAILHTTESIVTHRYEEWSWDRCWYRWWCCNNAPAGYATITPTESLNMRIGISHSFYGDKGTDTHFYDHHPSPKIMNLFSETVSQNPADFPTEIVFAEVGKEFGFTNDAKVIPISLVAQAMSYARKTYSPPPSSPIPPLLRLNRTDEGALYEEVVGKLPWWVNFDDKNIANFVVITHSTRAEFEPTLLANERVNAILPPPPVGNDQVITFFRPDRVRTTEDNLMSAMVLVLEPHIAEDGTVGSVHTNTTYHPATLAVYEAITDIMLALKIPQGSSIDGSINLYTRHRRNFPFSTELDNYLRHELKEYIGCGRMCPRCSHFAECAKRISAESVGQAFADFLACSSKSVFPIQNPVFEEERRKAIQNLKKQVKNGKRRENQRRRQMGSLDSTTRLVASVVFTAAAGVAGYAMLSADAKRRQDQRSLDKLNELKQSEMDFEQAMRDSTREQQRSNSDVDTVDTVDLTDEPDSDTSSDEESESVEDLTKESDLDYLPH